MPKSPYEQITHLYSLRAKDDANSTTLANTLNKDIETVFNSPEKFIFELLQNADDAGLADTTTIVEFILTPEKLIFAHNGKHFDDLDVEAICDNAQRKQIGKQAAMDKTGYKGIGFKSVFVISDCVQILSGDYQFRFDQHNPTWEEHDTDNPEGRYPWQIIPIWSPYAEPVLDDKINLEHVNFIFDLKPHIDLQEAFNLVLKNPNIILFLRRIQRIRISLYGKITEIALHNEENLSTIWINEQQQSQWLRHTAHIAIPKEVQEQIELMGSHECPIKLKQATSTTIQFAALIKNDHITKHNDSRLFSYLPTNLYLDLPFLVNADFLLTADRVALLKNEWNRFLFHCIGYKHIAWLAELAKLEQYRDDILALFTRQISSRLEELFATAYAKGADNGIQKIAFIPSYEDPMLLLPFNQVLYDKTVFFDNFKDFAPTLRPRIARYQLRYNEVLSSFEINDLADHIEKYVATKTRVKFHQSLMAHLVRIFTPVINRHHYYSFSAWQEISFILSDDKNILPPSSIYFPQKQELTTPKCLRTDFPHPALLEEKGLIDVLKYLGAKDLTLENLLKRLVDLIEENRITSSEDSIEIVMFLYQHKKEIDKNTWTKLKSLPLKTKTDAIMPAHQCYLPSTLNPEFDIETFAPQDNHFLSESYLELGIPVEDLKQLFIDLGVNDSLSLIKFSNDMDDAPRVSHYADYRQKIVPWYNSRRYRGHRVSCSAFPYMHLLPNPSYSKQFWKAFKEHWSSIRLTTSEMHLNYFRYFLRQYPSLCTSDGTLYISQQILSRTLENQLGERLSRAFITLTDCGVNLTEEQSAYFDFHTPLTAEEIVRLFKMIESIDHLHQMDDMVSLLKVILSQPLAVTQQEFLNRANIKLFAADGTLRSTRSLFLYIGNTLSAIRNSQNLLRKDPRLTDEEYSQLAKIFGIRVLSDKEIHLQHDQAFHKTEFLDAFRKELFIWANVEGVKDESNPQEIYHNWLQKIKTLDILAVESLTVTLGTTEEIILPLPIILYEQVLYYVPQPNMQPKIYQHLAHYLEISAETISHLMTRLHYDSPEAWLRDSQFDTLLPQFLNDDFVSEFANPEKKRSLLPSDPDTTPQYSTHHTADNVDQEVIFDLLDDDDSFATPQRPTDQTVVRAARREKFDADDDTTTHQRSLHRAADRADRKETADAIPHSLSQQQASPQPSESPRKRFKSGGETFEFFHHTAAAESLDLDKVPFMKLDISTGKRPSDPWESITTDAFLVSTPLDVGDPTTDWETALDDIVGDEEIDAGKTEDDLSGQPLDPYQQQSRSNEIASSRRANKSGRWGEELVYAKLKHHYQNKYPFAKFSPTHIGFTLNGQGKKGEPLALEVRWMNKINESQAPYDFLIIKNGQNRYIEVKASQKASKMSLHLSKNQWSLMHEKRDRFRFFCVFNTRKRDDVCILKIKDPAAKINSQELLPKEVIFELRF